MSWRKRNKFRDLKRSGQSVFYMLDGLAQSDPVIASRPNYNDAYYARMFADDACQVMPVPYDNNYEVQLSPNNSSFTELIIHALSDYNYHAHDLCGALYHFLNRVAHYLTYYGESVLEIVELLDPQTDEMQAFDFAFIHPMTVRRRYGRWVQYVPKEIAEEFGVERHIPLDGERLLFFHLPGMVQSSWKKMMESLASVENVTPSFGLPTYPSDSHRVPFDFKEHHRVKEQLVAGITKDIGWNMRNYSPEGVTEYYWLYRRLKFLKFKVLFRGELLKTLNEGLLRIGPKLDMNGQLSIAGLPTLDDVSQAQDEFEKGKISAKELLERLR